jgi:hypothetical protein
MIVDGRPQWRTTLVLSAGKSGKTDEPAAKAVAVNLKLIFIDEIIDRGRDFAGIFGLVQSRIVERQAS